MNRRAFLCGLALGTLSAPVAAEAQQAGTIRAVGILTSRPERSKPFEDALRELGWVDGKNVKLESRFTIDYQELPRLAKELVGARVDTIFAGHAIAARAARDASRTIPIVAVMGDPLSTGLVASLSRPGGNVTGLGIMTTELTGKRLEILTQAVPTARLIAVLANPRTPSTIPALHETESRARTLGVQILRLEASDIERVMDVLAGAVRKRADALLVLPDPMFTRNSARLIEAAARHRLPAIWEWRDFVEAGGLMSYAPGLDDLIRRAATYVDRILKGAKPGDLPVEQATKFELVINTKTAKALGLTIPPTLFLRADQVIE